MFQKRSLSTGFLVASLGIAAGLGIVSSPTVAEAGDCGNLKIDKVKAVCEKGGQKAVQKAMKKAMKAAGGGLKCTSCHEDQKSYKAKGNAAEDFKAKMLPHFD